MSKLFFEDFSKKGMESWCLFAYLVYPQFIE